MALSLIAPLASGIAGAVSGTAEFYARGTTTRVNVYSDPDGLAVIGNSATLDANGGIEAYADEALSVRVRSSLGVVVREFTVVAADNSVDVESRSFTGLLPTGSQGAGGAVDLQTVLDRWYASAGTLDFQVLRTGQTTPQTLIGAFSSVASANQPFFNVVSYGADSTGAIAADTAFKAAHDAAAAAGGGIVLVPGGTFLLGAAFSITSQKVSMMGFGAKATVIQSGVASGVAVTVNAGAATYSGSFIQDLTISAFSSGANAAPLQVVSTPGLLLRNVAVSGFALAADIQSRVILHGCDFTVPSSATAGDYVAKFSSNAGDSLIVGGSYTQSRATNTGALSLGVNNIAVIGTKVDISAITPGAGYGVDVGAANCKVEACDLITGAAATFAMRVNGDFSFSEYSNSFAGSGKHCALSNSVATTTRVLRGSRVQRYVVANATLTVNSTIGLSFDIGDSEFVEYIITSTTGTPVIQMGVLSSSQVSHGMRTILRFTNSTGVAIGFTYAGGVDTVVGPALANIAAGKRRVFDCIWYGPTPGALTTGVLMLVNDSGDF